MLRILLGTVDGVVPGVISNMIIGDGMEMNGIPYWISVHGFSQASTVSVFSGWYEYNDKLTQS